MNQLYKLLMHDPKMPNPIAKSPDESSHCEWAVFSDEAVRERWGGGGNSKCGGWGPRHASLTPRCRCSNSSAFCVAFCCCACCCSLRFFCSCLLVLLFYSCSFSGHLSTSTERMPIDECSQAALLSAGVLPPSSSSVTSTIDSSS
jgi:hypothetical protein